MKITFCIPSKNNLRYLKSSVESIKSNSILEYDIIVFVDSDNDGTESWLKQQGIQYIKNSESLPKGIAYAYNRCIEAANTEVVCMFHADMYMATGFDVNALKHLKPGIVVSGTRIEPPLHPEGKEKIVKNFGMYPEDFKKKEFEVFVEEQKKENENKVTYGIFAPWMCYKSELMEIGLHDELFHSYHEDSDIFNRMILNGMKCIQSRDSFVYHLTCRGGQFQDGVEKITEDHNFHKMKNASQRNYIRKWGSWINNDEYQHPIISNLYDLAFRVKNSDAQTIQVLEPWCKSFFVDCGRDAVEAYVNSEKSACGVDVSPKIKNYDLEPTNRVTVEFDWKDISNDRYINFITKISEILNDVEEAGVYEWDVFKVIVKDPTPIKVKHPFEI